ncbi:MAG: PilZ domain-containing protein [Candidatus Thiodiazotropha sp. (ex Monitilora ramsayi)]|nr:PilZ domain-containing protein [Candidatus Thiodiazotropha sp. (ex Monitilora ramsayi)]
MKLEKEKMAVERRYSKRNPMSGDVYIRYRKQRAFPAQAVNCSSQGIYLKTQSLSLLTGALVELEIFRDGRLWEIMGVVSHSQADGIGVMFWKPQPDLYESVMAVSARPTGITQLLQTEPVENHL